MFRRIVRHKETLRQRVNSKLLGVPDFPARMFHAVFAAAVPHTSVAPIVFRDKLSVRTGGDRLRFAGCSHLEKFPFLPAPPRIFDTQAVIDVLYVVFHREGEIAFAVKCAGHEAQSRGEAQARE